MSNELPSLSTEQLVTATGGMGADARWIMMKESSGNTHARNPHSTAFGAFQMTVANRRHYMGSDYASTDLNKQYAAATKYVNERYGGWHGARQFWQSHRWY
jgi:hypothetical protein